MSKDPMSKIRAGDVWKALERVLSDYHIGPADFDVVDRRPHPTLTVRFCGCERTMDFAGTPSSRRAPAIASGHLRRMLKDMQMAAIPSRPVPFALPLPAASAPVPGLADLLSLTQDALRYRSIKRAAGAFAAGDVRGAMDHLKASAVVDEGDRDVFAIILNGFMTDLMERNVIAMKKGRAA